MAGDLAVTVQVYKLQGQRLGIEFFEDADRSMRHGGGVCVGQLNVIAPTSVRAALRPGDRILSVQGVRATSTDHLVDLLIAAEGTIMIQKLPPRKMDASAIPPPSMSPPPSSSPRPPRPPRPSQTAATSPMASPRGVHSQSFRERGRRRETGERPMKERSMGGSGTVVRARVRVGTPEREAAEKEVAKREEEVVKERLSGGSDGHATGSPAPADNYAAEKAQDAARKVNPVHAPGKALIVDTTARATPRPRSPRATILVTGASSYVGRHLLARLVHDGRWSGFVARGLRRGGEGRAVARGGGWRGESGEVWGGLGEDIGKGRRDYSVFSLRHADSTLNDIPLRSASSHPIPPHLTTPPHRRHNIVAAISKSAPRSFESYFSSARHATLHTMLPSTR